MPPRLAGRLSRTAVATAALYAVLLQLFLLAAAPFPAHGGPAGQGHVLCVPDEAGAPSAPTAPPGGGHLCCVPALGSAPLPHAPAASSAVLRTFGRIAWAEAARSGPERRRPGGPGARGPPSV